MLARPTVLQGGGLETLRAGVCEVRSAYVGGATAWCLAPFPFSLPYVFKKGCSVNPELTVSGRLAGH